MKSIFSFAFLSSRVFHFLSICQLRDLLRLSFVGILYVAALWYANRLIYAEYLYASGQSDTTIVGTIDKLRQSSDYYSFNYTFRAASALRLGNIALSQENQRWQEAALIEIKDA